MASYKTEAIILSRINLGEADRIITLFSKHYGKLKVLAKGVRKIHSRKGGNLELFNQVKLVLAKGKNLDIITEVELVQAFAKWRKNLTRVGVAYYFTELIDKLTAEEQENQEVYNLLKEFLSRLSEKDLVKLIRQFEEKLLDHLGFGLPAAVRSQPGSLADYLEEITERQLKSKEVLKKIKYG